MWDNWKLHLNILSSTTAVMLSCQSSCSKREDGYYHGWGLMWGGRKSHLSILSSTTTPMLSCQNSCSKRSMGRLVHYHGGPKVCGVVESLISAFFPLPLLLCCHVRILVASTQWKMGTLSWIKGPMVCGVVESLISTFFPLPLLLCCHVRILVASTQWEDWYTIMDMGPIRYVRW